MPKSTSPYKELAHYIKVAVIAEEYFGRTPAWLTQKANNTILNTGRKSGFTPEERTILKEAITHIAQKITSIAETL